MALQALAEKNKYDALIALGCIIRGETYHFELVANDRAGVIRIRPTTRSPSPTPSSPRREAQALAPTDSGPRRGARVAVEMARPLRTCQRATPPQTRSN